MNNYNRNELIFLYFHMGMKYKEIIMCLLRKHGIVLSLRHLKRLLRTFNLYRRKNMSDVMDVAAFIEEELRNSGSQHGYRWMHEKCSQKGFIVTQQTIRNLQLIMDPEGVDLRRARKLKRRRYISRGPNWCWHIDGYDKISPYGIGIHGCIDGFSRYIIWLEACSTNSDPKVIAGYYLKSVEEQVACPVIVRADRGTENGHVAIMQTLLRSSHQDDHSGDRSFIYAKSTTNQRIESWWAILRKQCTQNWMNVFSGLKNSGHFSGDHLDKNLIRFCFLNLVQVSKTAIFSHGAS